MSKAVAGAGELDRDTTSLCFRRLSMMLELLCILTVLSAPLCAETIPQDFARSGTPFLRKYCTDCHAGESPEADVSLDSLDSTAALLAKRHVSDRIVEMLEAGLMPPEGARRPALEEIERFVTSVNGILDYADRHTPPNPGRVTMRRLNRTEYGNTIRDLMGIDFNPAEDFLADDIGHGFDNIGDVLTLPPVLMERYLSAAEAVSLRALSKHPAVPPQRVARCDESEPWGFDDADAIFRPIQSGPGDDALRGGPVFAEFDIPQGNYVFRTRLHAEAPAEQVVKVAILACSPLMTDEVADDAAVAELTGPALAQLRPFRIVQTIEVKSRRPLFPHEAKVKIPAIPGLNRVAVALYRPAADDAPVTVHVGWLTLEGPIVTTPCRFRQQVDRVADRPEPDRTRELASWLALRAYRRPPTEMEISRLVDLVGQAQTDGGSWEGGIALAIQAVLASPKFLFRVEVDSDPRSPAVWPLDEFQLASRLAYFLWSTMPDDELLDIAARGELTNSLDQQVRRMLADPRADSLVENFAVQWLQLKKFDTVAPDRLLFSAFNDRLRRSMREETRLFVQAIVRENRSVQELLGADFTFVDATLARHYGIADTNGNRTGEPPAGSPGAPIPGSRFERVQFQGPNQGGLLRQASILTVTSNPTRTSPVKRGRWVLEQLMGKGPPPPPPDIPELDDEKRQLTGTLRERMEQHRANPNCASCHAQMDPIGFAFENYDAIGRYRRLDGGEEIDATGTLPGGKAFNGPSELIDILKGRREQFVRCLTEKMLTYALGRGLENYDRPAVNRIVQSMAQDDDRIGTLVHEIVRSEPFRMRRGQ